MQPANPKVALREQNLLNHSFNELSEIFQQEGIPSFRLKQILTWVFTKKVSSFEKMTDLPQGLRDQLSTRFSLRSVTKPRIQRSKIDGTIKFTFVADVGPYSAVFLPNEKYMTLCISSQIGCAFQCSFCASGTIQFKRNLTSGEILDQIFWAEEITKEKIHNVLFMGMGEPLANEEAVIQSLRWMTAPTGFAMSPSRITVSTTGIPEKIEQLARERLHVNLALSLHAPTDKIREMILPVSSRFKIAHILKACKLYLELNKGELTIEYVLLKKINDDLSHARMLSELLRDAHFPHPAKVNLIPFNPVKKLPYEPPTSEQAEDFFKFLKKIGVLVHTRRTQGRDIEGACGQLL